MDKDWEHRAACVAEVDRLVYEGWDIEEAHSLWFPLVSHPESSAHAKRICSRCEVRVECLEANLDQRYGIFGGLDEVERDKLARRSRNRYWV